VNTILTITLNPAVDLATSVEKVVAGPKLYCTPPRVDPGGGGVNVARAIKQLGGHALALVAVGGSMGDTLLQLLATEGVPAHAVSVTGETRQSFAVTDESNGEQFRFSVPGQVLNMTDSALILSEISEAVTPDGFVVLSGGVAPGLSDDFPHRIQSAIAPKTDKLIVDTSKSPLTRLISAPVAPLHLLRIDRREAEQAAAHPMETINDSLTFAEGLIARGVARMVVTGRGAEGSVMVTESGRFFCHAPQVPVSSKVGAGDALVGSLTLALSRGETPDQALRWGVAAASATVGTEGTALCSLKETEALFEQCAVESV
jgi:6-phosphofructokinase 2